MTNAADLQVDAHALRRWRNAIILAFAVGGITVSSWGPRLPAVQSDLGADTALIGVILGCVTIGSICGLVASTPLLHYLGSKRALGGAILVVALAMALMGIGVGLGSIPVAVIAFIFVGFGIGTLDVLINVEGAAVESRAKRTLMPLMHGAWSVGAAIGAGVGALCAAADITPSAQFIGEAVVIALLIVVIVPSIAPGARAEAPKEELTRWQRIVEWAKGWLDWRLLLIGVVMLGVELGEGSANSWMTLAVHDDHGQTAAIAALFFTVFAVGEALTRIFGGPVVDRLGRVWTIRWTTALGAVGVVLFILGGNVWLVLIGVLLWSVGVSMGFPLGMSAAAESGPNPAARVSVVASVGYFANLAGPPVIGALAESVGLLNSLWLVVVFMVAAFAVAGSLRPVKRG
ncbi:MFS transporter [Planctomonas sp. JC2975]|uniref:MFS transporter n=1 Tax=Planctomonas sp. JC2975 TaxID=2729626 RepID=UPI0014737E3C|nr:MFS transporter [Planctomonas sp. JC2975]NNC13717.1 MFS transporter [Planctomonas sp. JC2975]